MIEFVNGFIAWANHQSPQCDIIVCRKRFYRRQICGDIFLVEPNDCIMVTEAKGNVTLDDFIETIENNKAVIQKYIDELQILFDSLMQKYFG